ncbi:uncharacterized protein LOC128250814 [Octopus bimaculoides]|uniref:uncharacterized protein LOC128250814 n=1 Tax=Octopus bimaculoides TaxID=37653 RepID=UPI0022E82B6A|nr:uncharacterized protein LOC128250814 [Octopus bimaculoides]
MLKFSTTLLLSLVLETEAFYFNSELDPAVHQKGQTAVTKQCLRFSRNLDCRFYNCLNARFPCGAEHLPRNNPRVHCLKAKRTYRLNDVGMIWIKSIMNCVVGQLTKIYRSQLVNCNIIRRNIFRIQKSCYTANDFCEVGWKHRAELWNMFKEPITRTKSDHYKRLWLNLGRISSKCNSKSSPALTRWIYSQLKLNS